MKLFKHIALMLLAAGYLSTACTYTINVLASEIPTSGANTVLPHGGNSKEIPAKLLAQRHLPLSTDIHVPSVHIGETEFPILEQVQENLLYLPFVQLTSSYYYSSLCDRAPPTV